MEQVIDVYVKKILLAAAAVAISRLPLFFFGDDGTFTNMVHAVFSTVMSKLFEISNRSWDYPIVVQKNR